MSQQRVKARDTGIKSVVVHCRCYGAYSVSGHWVVWWKLSLKQLLCVHHVVFHIHWEWSCLVFTFVKADFNLITSLTGIYVGCRGGSKVRRGIWCWWGVAIIWKRIHHKCWYSTWWRYDISIWSFFENWKEAPVGGEKMGRELDFEKLGAWRSGICQ